MGNLTLASAQLPAHIAARQANYVGSGMVVSDFQSTNRISLKGNTFTLNAGGDTKKAGDTLDVVIVGSIPGVQRLFYGGKYDPANPSGPECWSTDNKAPDANVPGPQANSCQMCRQNEKGSGSGGEGRACKYTKRMAVILDGDEGLSLYQLDVNASSIFGEDKPSRGIYSAKSFGEMLDNRRVDPIMLVTRLSFDSESATPSKIFFEPVRFLDEDELQFVENGLNRDTLNKMLVLVSQVPTKKGEITGKGKVADVPVQEAAAVKPKGFGKKATAEPAKVDDGVIDAEVREIKPKSTRRVSDNDLDAAMDALA